MRSTDVDSTDSTEDILDISVEAGMIILQNGGETYRTEETMISMAESLGVKSASAFVTPTVVMLTCSDPEGRSVTRIQRINDRSINLGKIAQVNELSRRLSDEGRPDRARGKNGAGGGKERLDEIASVLDRIRKAPLHHPVTVVLAAALASFFFSLLFMGSIREALLAFAIGAVLRLVLFLVNPLGLSGFIVSVLGGAVISLLSNAVAFSGIVSSPGNISISVLMALVPGLAIVNSIRDIIAGDLMAGSARLLEAFVIAAALSLGAAFGLMLFPSLGRFSPEIFTLDKTLPVFAFSFLATASFAWFFFINKYDIFWASLFGALGYVLYIISVRDYTGGTMGYFLGALCVGLLSESAAAIFKKPATVYIVPGIIPLVPGGGMYETMFAVVLGRKDAAAFIGFNTLIAAASIAVGVALASSLARLVGRIRNPAFRPLH